MLRLTHMILVSQKISFKMTDFAILVGNTHRFKGFLFKASLKLIQINFSKKLFLQKQGRSNPHPFLAPQTSCSCRMIMATHVARELGILLFTLQDLELSPPGLYRCYLEDYDHDLGCCFRG